MKTHMIAKAIYFQEEKIFIAISPKAKTLKQKSHHKTQIKSDKIPYLWVWII